MPNPIVPEDWLRKAADLVVQVHRIYGGPISVCGRAITVDVLLSGKQDDEHSCSFGLVIPLPRRLARVTGTGKGNADEFAEALENVVRDKVELWRPDHG